MEIKTFEDPRLRLLKCGHANLPPKCWDYSGVSLPYWRLYWNTAPGAFIHYDRQDIELTPSRAVLVAPNTVFSTSNNMRVSQLFVHFQIPTFYVGVAPQIIRFTVTPLMRKLIEELIHLLQKHTPPSWRLSLVARALIELAVSMIMDKTIRIPRLDPRVLKALAFLEENLGAVISNDALAQQAGISVSAFNRLFRTQMGRSPQAYRRLKCVEKACLMLLSDASVKQIAKATGFCDRYHFSRTFKRIQKIGPAEFRRLNQNLLVAAHTQL